MLLTLLLHWASARLVMLRPFEWLVVRTWTVLVESSLATEGVDLAPHVVLDEFARVVPPQLLAQHFLPHLLVPLLVLVLSPELLQLPILLVGVNRVRGSFLDLLL